MTPQTDHQNNIVAAIETELAEVEQRAAKLRDLRRLALELNGSSPAPRPTPPPAAPPAKTVARKAPAKRTAGKRALPWTVEEAFGSVRDAIADEPLSVQAIFRTVGKSRNTHTENVVRRVLEQLRAEKDSGGRWSLPDEPRPPANPEPAVAASNGRTEPAAEVDRAYLERALLRELQKAPATPAAVAEAIDAPLEEVKLACGRLVGTGALCLMNDGTYCG